MLVNPVAGRGRAAGLIPAARAALERIGGATVLTTASRGDEATCVREALARRATTIVALGGDGTVSRVAAELVKSKSEVPLAIFSAGTGNDFAKSLAVPAHDFVAMTRLVASGQTRAIDAGRVDDVVFVNAAGFGFDAAVLQRSQKPSVLRGMAVYVTTALGQLLQYPGFTASVTPGLAGPRRWLMMVFANGGWFGGAFRIAPRATLSDGLLDAVFIGDAPAFRRAVLFGRAVRGSHLGEPEVTTHVGPRWTIDFPEPPVYEADGELRYAASSSVTVESLPAAFRAVA